MAETHTDEPSAQDAAPAPYAPYSPATSSALFMHSIGAANGGDDETVPRSSPAPTGLSINLPKKRKHVEYDDDDEGEEEQTPKRKRVTKKGIEQRMIPRTFEECEDIDKKLLSMRDGGANWPAIRDMWRAETGEETGKSTLPNRYMRLKVNFTVIHEKDNALLLKCHREVEEAFEKERWSLVSKAMSKEGTQVYVPEVLSLQFKKLMQQGANLRAGRDVNYGVEER